MITQRLLNPKIVSVMAVWAVLIGLFSSRAAAMPTDSLAVSAAASTREAQIEKIVSVLSRPEAQIHLRAAGIRQPELRVRLSKLNDSQLTILAQRADTLKAAGELGLLIFALVVAILIVIFVMLLKKT